MREIMEIILAVIERKRMLVSLPFGLAKLQALLLQFAPGPLKLTPDQVALLRGDNVVSDAAKAAGLTLEGWDHAGFAGSHCAAVPLALPQDGTVSEEERVAAPSPRTQRSAQPCGGALQTRAKRVRDGSALRSGMRMPAASGTRIYFPSASAIRPRVPTMTRHHANSVKPWRVT